MGGHIEVSAQDIVFDPGKRCHALVWPARPFNELRSFGETKGGCP
jgi:hypothetical protein